jgi:pimeloyl-ACP methyl ester carboxylesterase
MHNSSIWKYQTVYNMSINQTNPWEHEPSKTGLLSLRPNHALYLSTSGPIRSPNTPLIIVIPGLASHASEWIAVNRSVTKFARTLLYDRSGYGLSSEISPNTTISISAVDIATELNDLLRVADLKGPFLVVCHSYGGIIAREFVHLRRDDVHGMVFVDANQELNTIEGPWPAPYIDSVAEGLDVWDVVGINQAHKLLPDEWEALLSQNKEYAEKHARVAAAEAKGYIGSGAVLAAKRHLDLKDPPLLGSCPVSVIKGRAYRDFELMLEAGTKAGSGTEEERRQFAEMIETYDHLDEKWQKGLLGLSSRPRWVGAGTSGHNVHLTEPEVIVEEVRWILENLEANMSKMAT